MSSKLLKHTVKRIQALKDINEGRLHLKGPRYQLHNVKHRQDPYPLEPGWKNDDRIRNHVILAESYTTLRSEGETCECDQETARKLVSAGAAQLLEGGAYSIFEESDGLPRVDFWHEKPMPAALSKFEPVEALKDGLFGFAKKGDRFRVQRRHIQTLCWIDSPAADHELRILRPDPAPAAVAARAKSQGQLLYELWTKQHPGEPVPEAIKFDAPGVMPGESSASPKFVNSELGWSTAWATPVGS